MFERLRKWYEDRVLYPAAVEAVRGYVRPVWDRLPQSTTAKAGVTRAQFLRHAATHPEEYFMCSVCGDGPWHASWEEPWKKSRYAKCGNCTGAA